MDRATWRFFFFEAGYVVGERALGAARLARAEAALGTMVDDGAARVRWEDDPDSAADGEPGLLSCLVERPCGACGRWEVVASLGGVFDDRDHRRVVVAELACEVLAQA